MKAESCIKNKIVMEITYFIRRPSNYKKILTERPQIRSKALQATKKIA
jgi:hypothetical protein